MMEHVISKTNNRTQEGSLNLEEVADILNVEASTVIGWVKSNKLPYSFIGPGRDLRFRMNDIMGFIMK